MMAAVVQLKVKLPTALCHSPLGKPTIAIVIGSLSSVLRLRPPFSRLFVRQLDPNRTQLRQFANNLLARSLMWTITTYRKSGHLFILRVMEIFRQLCKKTKKVTLRKAQEPLH